MLGPLLSHQLEILISSLFDRQLLVHLITVVLHMASVMLLCLSVVSPQLVTACLSLILSFVCQALIMEDP